MSRLKYLVATYFAFVLLFMLQKPLFMLWQGDLYSDASVGEWFQVIAHGIPLDLSAAAYILVLPMLLTLVSVWLPGRWYLSALRVYGAIIVLLLAVICVADAELYGYWGFRIDVTPLFYLQSPADAMASIPVALFFVAFLFIAVYAGLVGFLFDRYILRPMARPVHERNRLLTTVVYLVLTAFLFLPIRGGVSASTMNVGWAYFSERIELNHAAVNPAFSLMASLSKGEDFSSMYRFMSPAEADAACQPLLPHPVTFPDEANAWLTTPRPDVVLVILESVTKHVLDEPGVMPCFNALIEEGIWFPHFYANSFRTDRGLVAVLSGYPAQPTASVMKYPSKSQSLPSIARSLRQAGYGTELWYGGDVDFTNMRSYFYATGYGKVISGEDFSSSENSARWGVPDHITFSRFSQEILAQEQQPYFKTLLTLSSHEPFDVPMHRIDEPFLNSVAYTDSCLGAFVDTLRNSPRWDNLLLIFVADHTMRYPAGIQEHEVKRHHIPMLWCGGAVKEPRVVENYASQIDLAATLLAQMKIDYSDFAFSKNMADTTQHPFAYYTYNDGLGYVDAGNRVVYDCNAGAWLLKEGPQADACGRAAQAFLQKLYDDLGTR